MKLMKFLDVSQNSRKDRNVLSILLLNQNLVVSLCRSFSFQCGMLMVEIKDVYFVISIETGSLSFGLLALNSLAQFIFHKF